TAISAHLASDFIIDDRPVIAIAANGKASVAWQSYAYATNLTSIKVASAPTGGDFVAPITLGSAGLVTAPAITIGATGVIYVGWDDWGFNAKAPYNTAGRLLICSSASGGDRFGAPQLIAYTNIGFGRK